MTADLSLFGVFINAGLVAALIALALHVPLRWAMRRVGAYRLFWHPSLVDVASFVIVWGGVAWALQSSASLVSRWLE